MEKGLVFHSPDLDVYSQMAADEILCGCNAAQYILRFFNWASPGITYGYSQRRRQVEAAVRIAGSSIKDLVRRPTGGGIVFHDDDVTFSFIFPSPELLFEPHKTYERLHTAINRKYRECGEDFTLMSGRTESYAVNSPAMACFSKPVTLDILYNDRKVLGGALRKTGTKMLYQGSFQFPGARKRQAFHRRIIASALSEEFRLEWETVPFSEEMLEELRMLAVNKYRTEEWNSRI
ncbi:MAG: lipoate--protein ligase family protein [Elusimicrobiales bacterium]|nr:lipoate--protein ligase family protein [Elusimicrobiales bacterium]